MLSALLLTASLVTFQQAPQAWTYKEGPLTDQQQLAKDIYKQLVEIHTGVTTGNITEAAEAMAVRFREAGIPEGDVFVGGPVPKRHNVVARIRGKNPNRTPLLLLAHLDVVEALKSDWSDDLDPFVFTERDGYYYGRGTADDKAMAAIFVANVYRMRADGFVPDRDIIIALTSDEESGPYDGAGWLVENHFDLVDAGLVINEGGRGVHDGEGTPIYNGVQAAEKITMNFTLRVTNPGGHSSVPRPDNAITALADALGKVGRFSFPTYLNPVTKAYFTEMAKLEKPEMGRAMVALVEDVHDETALAVVTSNPAYRALLETTCVATLLSGGHASNALPQLAEANVNCRVYPTETADQVQETLQRVVDDSTVGVLIKSQRPPTPPTELLPEVMGPVGRITRDMWGDIPVIPVMSTGATDSRWFRARGLPALGVSGLFSDPAVDSRAHGRDERMRVKSFFEGHEFLYRLTRALAGPNPIS